MYMKLCLLSSQDWHRSDNPVSKAKFSVLLQPPLGQWGLSLPALRNLQNLQGMMPYKQNRQEFSLSQ